MPSLSGRAPYLSGVSSHLWGSVLYLLGYCSYLWVCHSSQKVQSSYPLVRLPYLLGGAPSLWVRPLYLLVRPRSLISSRPPTAVERDRTVLSGRETARCPELRLP